MSGQDLKPGDIASYALPVVVKVISRQFYMVEVEFQDGTRRFVDDCYLSGAHQVADDYEWKTHSQNKTNMNNPVSERNQSCK